jgi:hypothetical protein
MLHLIMDVRFGANSLKLQSLLFYFCNGREAADMS